ncbi:hypothetical protein [Bradyrhizobium sp. STM 3809]|uniref:hypothetical protein n=1 Tax=Bradyrhizobium sp. STM 3809 TaxID=551936 RepID=UPI000240A341|nr:hypothetical protein [Bradyrhizobium sp. STM 3809]CCE03613.1 conserved hypothetical protein [Bradyrhizobium sp. STM 3809]
MAPLALGAEAGGAAAAAAPARDVTKDSGPFGGCEPIGLTASGELVFPLECKKLIKKPTDGPVAADDKAAAEDRTASTDAKPSAGASATADAPAAPEAKPASQAAAPVPAAGPKPVAAADKPEAHGAAAADPAAPASAAAIKPALSKPGLTKPGVTKPALSKAASKAGSAGLPSGATTIGAVSARSAAANVAGKPASAKVLTAKTAVVTVKEPALKGGQAEAPQAANKPSTMSAIKRMIVMAKPANTGAPAAARPQAEDRPLRTASMPACMQFRSYNAATRSYRGFDGHIYACR